MKTTRQLGIVFMLFALLIMQIPEADLSIWFMSLVPFLGGAWLFIKTNDD